MLNRYKKTGGFVQLLSLIETSNREKQEKFLKLIEDESKPWADKIKEKMLTLKIVLSWPPDVVGDIFSRIQDLTLAVAKHGLDPADWEKATKTFDQKKMKFINDMAESRSSTPAEIATAFTTILTTSRAMINQGFVYLEKLNPELILEDDIEDVLEKTAPRLAGASDAIHRAVNPVGATPNKPKPKEQAVDSAVSAFNGLSVPELHMGIRKLAEENAELKRENEKLRNLLAQAAKSA
jgi:hypothetical protein